MTVTPRHTGYAAALRRLLGVAAFLGLFAMHGVAAHGTTHSSHAGEPVAVAAAAEHDHFGAAMALGEASAASSMPRAPSDPAPDPDPASLVGLCLAVLLLGVVVAAFLGRRFLRARRLGPVRVTAGWPTRARRDRDPPSLFALSIQRC